MEIDKICRTCLALSGPFLSLYDGSATSCLANMLGDFTEIKPKSTDKMPDKVCLSCISEINRCYSFKMKCKSSDQTLRQLLPDAVPQELERERKLPLEDKAVQASECGQASNAKVKLLGINQEAQTEATVSPACNDVDIIKDECGTTNYKSSNTNQTEEEFIQVVPTHTTQSESISAISQMTLQSKRKRKKSTEVVAMASSQTIVEMQESGTTNEAVEGYPASVVNENSCEEISEIQYEDDKNEAEPTKEANFSDNEKEVAAIEKEFTISDDESNDLIVEPKRSSARNRKQRFEQKCPDCDMTFICIKSLHRHMMKRHEWTRAVEDNPELTTVQLFDDNKPVENQQKSNNEEEGSDTTATVCAVAPPPISIATTPSTSKYFCEKCNAGFAGQKSLNFHRKRNTCTVRNFTCTQCDRVFLTRNHLVEHMTTHVLANICTECSKVYKTTEQLSQHMIDEHDRNIRNQCKICKKVFTMVSALKDHMRIHSGEKPFLCTECGKTFSQNANLKQHIMRHAKEKKFKCDVCESSYVTKAELFSHKRIHTGDHPFKCEYCGQTFTTSSSMMKHKRKHTGERPYACDHCPLRFASLNVMKNHRRTHTGEKPFKCNFCDKTFTQKGDCQIHQRIHTGERNYACYCGDTFMHLATLRTHQKRHQKQINNQRTHVVRIVQEGTAETAADETQDEQYMELVFDDIC